MSLMRHSTDEVPGKPGPRVVDAHSDAPDPGRRNGPGRVEKVFRMLFFFYIVQAPKGLKKMKIDMKNKKNINDEIKIENYSFKTILLP